MLCTSVFGVGIDYPKVRKVLIIGLPFSFEDYAQMCERAGRDGLQVSEHLFYRNRSVLAERMIGMVDDNKELLRQFAQSDLYMDMSMTACYLEEGNVNCDNCKSNRRISSTQSDLKDLHNPLQVCTTSIIDKVRNASMINNFRIKSLLAKVKSICPICLVILNEQLIHDLDFIEYVQLARDLPGLYLTSFRTNVQLNKKSRKFKVHYTDISRNLKSAGSIITKLFARKKVSNF